MKRLCYVLLGLLAGVSAASAVESIDTLSYSAGFEVTLASMAGKNDLMTTPEDFKEYIRGLEDTFRGLSENVDPSYLPSYQAGVILGFRMLQLDNGEEFNFPCFSAGLRRVGSGEIVLPDDTIAAMDIVSRHIYDKHLEANKNEEALCEYNNAAGVMMAYNSDLLEFIRAFSLETEYGENRQAFATGLADILESLSDWPKTAYDFGRAVSFSTYAGTKVMGGDDVFVFPQFIAGARAALMLDEELVPREEVENYLMNRHRRESGMADDKDMFMARMKENIDKLEVEMQTPYMVDWTVVAAPVAEESSAAGPAFAELMSKLQIEEATMSGLLMAEAIDEDGNIYETALSAIANCPLPEGYKWFCGRRNDIDMITSIGVMQTSPAFTADVYRASVDFVLGSALIALQWKYDMADTLKWLDFTGANIGRHVAVEIDGTLVCAPRVNQPISGGACSATGLTPEEINRLFKDAQKEQEEDPMDRITMGAKLKGSVGCEYVDFDGVLCKDNIEGATIQNLRTGEQVSSDIEGNFVIFTTTGDSLRVSAPGYVPKTVRAKRVLEPLPILLEKSSTGEAAASSIAPRRLQYLYFADKHGKTINAWDITIYRLYTDEDGHEAEVQLSPSIVKDGAALRLDWDRDSDMHDGNGVALKEVKLRIEVKDFASPAVAKLKCPRKSATKTIRIKSKKK